MTTMRAYWHTYKKLEINYNSYRRKNLFYAELHAHVEIKTGCKRLYHQMNKVSRTGGRKFNF
jgi:hypothetical protein